MTFEWSYTNKLPVPNTPVWGYNYGGYTFDIVVWTGTHWTSWIFFNHEHANLNVIAWSPINWSEVDQSLPEEMRILD